MRRRNFTLLELVTTMSIGMTLSALAIPAFHDASLKARFAEVGVVLEGLRAAVMTIDLEDGSWFSTNLAPDSVPSKAARNWRTNGPSWDELLFTPDGSVYGSYGVGLEGRTYSVGGGVQITCQTEVCVVGVTDLDGDGQGQAVLKDVMTGEVHLAAERTVY
jgi:type II secretory pathway pseudopilin PulG